jgi:hypothetical protein
MSFLPRLLLLACLLATGWADAAAQEGNRLHPLMLIYDASGSMDQYVDGRVPGKPGPVMPIKRALAIATTTQLLERLRPYASGLSAGLTLFGHRRVKDCSDIEVVRPVSPLANARTIEELARIIRATEPKGRTPLMSSIRAAIASVHSPSQTLSIVVVTDGEDECGFSPCETIDAIHAEAPNLVVHLIGLQSKRRNFEAVQCLAERTGGLALRITDPSEIDEAVRRVVEQLGARVAPVVRQPRVGILSARAWIGLGPDAEFKAATPTPTLQVRQANGAIVQGLGAISGGPVERPLPPGDYTVRVRVGEFEKEFKVVVNEAQKTLFELPIVPGAIVARLVDPQGVSVEIDVEWEVAHMDSKGERDQPPYQATGRQLRLQLPPGRYRITARLGERAVWEETQVEAENQRDMRLVWR